MRSLPLVDDDHVIRLFPEWSGGSPLWWAGMEDPRSFGLSEDLSVRLEAWADTFDAFADYMEPTGWKPGFDVEAYERDGEVLAREVSDVLGSAWAVDRPDDTPDETGKIRSRRFRSNEPPEDSRAAEVAERKVAAKRSQDEYWKAAVARGVTFDFAQVKKTRERDGEAGPVTQA